MTFTRRITALLACLMFATSGQAVPIRRLPGQKLPDNYYRTERDNPAVWAPERSYAYTRGAAPGDYAINDTPRKGNLTYPLILVQFPDLQFSFNDRESLMSYYEDLYNGNGCTDTVGFEFWGNRYYRTTPSVSDYFRDQSYGQYVPKFEIIGPITASRGYAYYGQGDDANVEKLVLEICDSIITNNLANLSGYARNGMIDQLSLIYAGSGENYDGSDPNTIWPHADIVYVRSRDTTVYKSGIRRIKYSCSCEIFWDTDSIPDGIGTFCHEFSHTLGLPDFYNTDYNNRNEADKDDEENAAMGYWSLMDYGCYNNMGYLPVGYTAFEKYSLGWLDLEEITYQGSYDLDLISTAPNPQAGIHTAYRLSTGDDGQFIILENRNRTGWYRYDGGKGLMVTAVDYNQSGWQDNYVNNYNPKHYRILPADNNYDRETHKGDLFPYQYTDSTGVHVIDSITTKGQPELKAGTSYPSFSIYNITRNGDIVSFDVVSDLPTRISSPKQEEISISLSDGELTVSAPRGSTVSIYDISGKPASRTVTSAPVQKIPLPGSGIWIVKCGNITRKVRL